MNLAAAAAALAAVPVAAEVFKRRISLPTELPRKAVHVGCGILAAPLAYVLPYRQILVLAGLFAVVMTLSRAAEVFTAVHDVDRVTYGELAFPVGVGLLAVLHPARPMFAYALLVLALADTAAAMAGMRFGRRQLPFGGKSLVGSATFFAVAFALGLPFTSATGAALVALVAAAAEAYLRRGLDNLVLPLLVAGVVGLA
jgi:dolichol kinase